MKSTHIHRRFIFVAFSLFASLANVSQATDEKIAELKTLSGKTFLDVLVTKVTPSEITIIHESGAAHIPLKDLPDDLKTKFGYDPAKAEAYAKAVAQAEKQAAGAEKKAAEVKALDKTKKVGVFIVDRQTDNGLLVNSCSIDNGDFEQFTRLYTDAIRTGGGKEAPILCRGDRKYILLDVPKKEYVEGVFIGGLFLSAGTVKAEDGSRMKAFRYVGVGKKTDQCWKCIDWEDYSTHDSK